MSENSQLRQYAHSALSEMCRCQENMGDDVEADVQLDYSSKLSRQLRLCSTGGNYVLAKEI